jgi:pimeloyl-ACP methyl ester carboxylesterase
LSSPVCFASLYDPTVSSLVPLLIDEADKGNFTGFLALNAISDSMATNMSMGMQFSVLCAEDAPRIDRTSIDRDSAGTFLGTGMTELRLKACDIWPHATMDPDYYINKPSDVPALILSGHLDPVTPPSWGEEIASKWKNARHVIVPASAHGAWNHGCVMKLMSQFLNDGSAANLDTSCVDRVKRPPFFLGPSGPDPLGGLQK